MSRAWQASHVEGQVAGGGHARCGWGLGVAEVGSVLCRCGRQESGLHLLDAARHVGVDVDSIESFLCDGVGRGAAGLSVDDEVAVGSIRRRQDCSDDGDDDDDEVDFGGAVDDQHHSQGACRAAAVGEDASLLRAARQILLSAAAPSSHAQVRSVVKSCCDASKPWVSLGVEEALEGALHEAGCFHPLVALALCELPHRRSGALYPSQTPWGSEGRRSDWLWNEWSHSDGSNDGQGVDDEWPRACSIWMWEGPRALIECFDGAPGGGGREELWTTAKVLSGKRRERGRGLEAAQDVFDVVRQQQQQGEKQLQSQDKQRARVSRKNGDNDHDGGGGGGGGGALMVGAVGNEEARIADALTKHWNQARLISLVLAASLLGTEHLSSGDRDRIEEIMLAWAGGAGGDEPVVAKLTVLHVLWEGMAMAREVKRGMGDKGDGGSESAVGVKRQRGQGAGGSRSRLESLWCVFAKVLTGMAGSGVRTMQARRDDAIQAAELMKGNQKMHGLALELAESFVAAESWEDED